MKKIIRCLLVGTALLPTLANAGSIAVTPGSGTTVGAGTDGTAQIPAHIICGASASATLYATCVNQAIVNASGQFLTLTTLTGTVPLPTGASTAALQSTINTTLGAPMQNTGGTVAVTQPTAANLNATVSPVLAATWGLLAQNATTSGQLAQLMMGAVTTAAPTYTTGQSSPLSLDTAGNLRVVTSGGGGSVTVVGPLGSAAVAAGVSVTESGTKTTASPALPAGGTGGIGWLSDIDTNVQAGFDATTTSSRVIPASNVTPIDCSGTATSTATNATGLGITTIHGFTIQNENASVNIGFSLTGAAVLGSPGTFTLLPTGQSPNSYSTPVGFGSNHSVSVVAPSSAVYTCSAF